jgi:hypothetical protein
MSKNVNFFAYNKRITDSLFYPVIGDGHKKKRLVFTSISLMVIAFMLRKQIGSLLLTGMLDWSRPTVTLFFSAIVFSVIFGVFRRRNWVWFFWVPVAVLSAFGTYSLLGSILISFSLPSGPDGGFMGMAAMFIILFTLPFLIFFIICLRFMPRPDCWKPMWMAGAFVLWIVVAFMFDESKRAVLRIALSDQDGHPLSNLTVNCSIRNDGLAPEPSEYTYRVVTNEQGVLELKLRPNESIYLEHITKEGYESVDAKNHIYTPLDYSYIKGAQTPPLDVYNPNKPVVFYLRKKGEPAYLIGEWHKNQRFDRAVSHKFKIPLFTDWLDPNGNRHPSIDSSCVLIRGRASADTNDKYFVTFFAPDANSGVLLSNTLLYEAPENGYQRSTEQTIRFVKEDTRINRYLYVKGENKSYYSRIDMQFDIFDNRFYIDCIIFTNPEGSRNLEYDSDFQTKEWKRRDQKHEQLIKEQMHKSKSGKAQN